MRNCIRSLFLTLLLTSSAVPLVGCGGPEYAKEGEGKEMTQPGAMDAMTGMGGKPEEMKPQ